MECALIGRFKRPAACPLLPSSTSNSFSPKKRRAVTVDKPYEESVSSAPAVVERHCTTLSNEDVSVSSSRLWPKTSAPTVLRPTSVNAASVSSGAPPNLDDSHAVSCNTYQSYSSPVSSAIQHKPYNLLPSLPSSSGSQADEWRASEISAARRAPEPSTEGEVETSIVADEEEDEKGEIHHARGTTSEGDARLPLDEGDEEEHPVKLLLEDQASEGVSCGICRPPTIVGYCEPAADSILENGWTQSPMRSPAQEETHSVFCGASSEAQRVPAVLHKLYRLQRELLVDWNRHSKEVELFQRGMCSLFHSRDRVLHRLHAVLHETQHLIEAQPTQSNTRAPSDHGQARYAWESTLDSSHFGQLHNNSDVWCIPPDVNRPPSTAINDLPFRESYPLSPTQKTEAWGPPPFLTPDNAQFKQNVSSDFHSPWQAEQGEPTRSYQNAWDAETPASPSDRQLWPVNPKLKEDTAPLSSRERAVLSIPDSYGDDKKRWYSDAIKVNDLRQKGDSNDEQSISLCSEVVQANTLTAAKVREEQGEDEEDDDEDEEEDDDEEAENASNSAVRSCQPRTMSIARKLSSPKGQSTITWPQTEWDAQDRWPREDASLAGTDEGPQDEEEDDGL